MSILRDTLIVALLFFFFSEVSAHGSLSIRINEKTIEISEDPKNKVLYFERGYLYYQHDEYKNAIKDYLEAQRLGLHNKLLCFRKAEAYYKANELTKASKEVELCLEYDSLDIKTYKLKAKILFNLNKYSDAIIAYKYVIENTEDLRPEDYINYSEFILASNKNYKHAIAALDLGIEKLGKNIIVFQLKKIEYLKKSNQNEKVLALYNTLIENSKRKEFLYYEKAKYLFDIGDTENSNIALQQATLAINELKLSYQNTIAVKKLQATINDLKIKL